MKECADSNIGREVMKAELFSGKEIVFVQLIGYFVLEYLFNYFSKRVGIEIGW